MHRSRLEILVGLFVILALVILAFMVFFISGVYVFKQGYRIQVLFDYVSRLEKGASVRLAGIPVGSVSDLVLQTDEKTGKTTVKTMLFIDKNVRIRGDAKIRIEGIYGLSTPYLEIRELGNPGERILKEGDTIVGIDPVSVDDLAAKGQMIADDLQETIVRINRFMGDPEVLDSLKGTLVHLNSLTATLNDIMTDKEAPMTNTIQNLEQSSRHLKSVLEKVDKGQGTAGKLLSDDTLYKELEEFVKDVKRHPWKLLKKGDEEGGKKKGFLGIF